MKRTSDDAYSSANWKKRLSVLAIGFALVLALVLFAGRVHEGARKSQGFWQTKKIEHAQQVERAETLQRQAQETREAREP